MGMIANYQEITDIELQKIQCIDDVEELQNKGELEICDIDKMWDALHFLLTGKIAAEPIEDNLLSEAIVGQYILVEEDFVAGTSSDRVRQIADKLQQIIFDEYGDNFSMRNFAENQIYPNIWGNEEEADEIKQELMESFESLRDFYVRMAEKGCAVLVSIY